MINGFKPIYDNESKILILGSLPSSTSIDNQEYYYNPNNHFWKILKSIYNDDIVFNCYEDKKLFLKKHHIALWDVIKCANRVGSLDSNIKNEKYNDINWLIKNSKIKYIYINGRKAENSFKKYMKYNNYSFDYILLPSSSPANARYSFEKKTNEWKIIVNNK